VSTVVVAVLLVASIVGAAWAAPRGSALRFAIPTLFAFLLADWLVVAAYADCDRGDCGEGYDIATVGFYVLGTCLLIAMAVALAGALARRVRQ
jgi:hypothetical protein